MKKRRIDIISLGCSKNLVDSERLMRRLSECGFVVCHNSDDVKGDIVVVNTCGFIGDAKEESINTILSCAEAKNEGRVEQLYVMGCLSERYRDELAKEIPEIDRIYGKYDWETMVADLAKDNPQIPSYERTITTPPHYSYVKISEGCNRFCAFCAIPLITGKLKSRDMDEILSEVRYLTGKGVKEFNIIAQDLSAYGLDRYRRLALPELVDKMAKIEGAEWIRLHYAYPAQFPFDLLDVMAAHPNVCKYLDIALQHIDNRVLSNMRRHITKEETLTLIDTIRRKVPNIHLRTTLMVGFPGEDEKAFDELKRFVAEARFERMGAFAYCEEDGTYAAKHYADDIPQEVKDRRLAEIMELQEAISLETNRSKIGTTLKVIVDREEPDYFVGRTEFDSPEVDPEVLIKKNEQVRIGEFCQAKITDALPFELMAEVANA